MTSTTFINVAEVFGRDQPASRASAEPRYRAGSFPSALYPVRVDTTAELSSTSEVQEVCRCGSSHARSSSSNAAGVAPVFTSASTQPRAAFGHFAFNSTAIFISVIVRALNRTIKLPALQLLQAPDVRHEPLNFLGASDSFHKRILFFPFSITARKSASDLPATAASLKLTTPMLFPAGEFPCRSRHGKRALRFKGAGALSSAFVGALKPCIRNRAASRTIPVRNEIIIALLRNDDDLYFCHVDVRGR